MMWLVKIAKSDRDRILSNIQRLENLGDRIHDLSYFVIASNSGGYKILESILEENIVKGRPVLYKKLYEAYVGENNQKLALDNPIRFKNIMVEAQEIIKREIVKENRKLSDLKDE